MFLRDILIVISYLLAGSHWTVAFPNIFPSKIKPPSFPLILFFFFHNPVSKFSIAIGIGLELSRLRTTCTTQSAAFCNVFTILVFLFVLFVLPIHTNQWLWKMTWTGPCSSPSKLHRQWFARLFVLYFGGRHYHFFLVEPKLNLLPSIIFSIRYKPSIYLNLIIHYDVRSVDSYSWKDN